jgi:hypothetical protein
MLRDRHEQEATALRLGEQRDLLLKKLTETEEDNVALKAELMARDRTVTDLRLRLEAQRVCVAFYSIFLCVQTLHHPLYNFTLPYYSVYLPVGPVHA